MPAKIKKTKKLKGTIEFSLKLQKGSATAQNTRNNQRNSTAETVRHPFNYGY